MSGLPRDLSVDIQAGQRRALEREGHIQNIFVKDPRKWIRERGAEACAALEILSMHEDLTVARIAQSDLLSEVPDYLRNGCPFPDPYIRQYI